MGLPYFPSVWYYNHCCGEYPYTCISAHSCFYFSKSKSKVRDTFPLTVWLPTSSYSYHNWIYQSFLFLFIYWMVILKFWTLNLKKICFPLTTGNTEQFFIAFPFLWTIHIFDLSLFLIFLINSLQFPRCRSHHL